MTDDVLQVPPSIPGEAERLVAEIEDGATICAGGNGSFPLVFLHALAARTDLTDVTLNHPMRCYPFDSATEYVTEGSGIWHVSDFTWDVEVREAVRSGRASFRPNQPHEAARQWGLRHPTDVFVAQASPPDRHGYLSLGVFGGWSKSYLDHARPARVVLEVNHQQPRVLGDVSVHRDQVDAMFSVDYPLPQVPMSTRASEVDEQIADHVVDMIPDGATLQIGVGNVPDVIVKRLMARGRSGLGIHTENLSDALVDLIESGAADNRAKSLDRGRSVCTLALGTDRVYDFLDDNPGVAMLPTTYVNDPAVIAANPRQHSVNAALMVDLTGQVASESIGVRHFSGTGGQWEFVYGANHSAGGRGIITLTSTAVRGTVSTIVDALPVGAAVTVSRNDAPTIVTEYGAANLRGLSGHERAAALVSIAHPDFRNDLRASARRMGLMR